MGGVCSSGSRLEEGALQEYLDRVRAKGQVTAAEAAKAQRVNKMPVQFGEGLCE